MADETPAWAKASSDDSTPDWAKKKTAPPKDEPKKDESDFATFTKNALKEVGGAVVEPVLKAGSAMIAKPVSDIAGLAATGKELISPTKGGGDPAGFKRDVQERLTYEPRTTAGKSPWNPLNAIPEGIGKFVGWAGDKAGQGTEAALKAAKVSPALAGPIG